MAYIGKEPIVGNFQKCDAITVVNGQAAYTLQVSSTNVVPESANHMLVSLNGILQAPTTSFSVSGSTLTFASNLITGDVIDFVMLLGNVLDLGVPSDATVTTAKIADSSVTYAKTDGNFAKTRQIVTTQTGAVATTTTIFPEDDTIPQNNEGGEFMTLAITPKSSTSKLLITAQVFSSVSTGTRWGIALFKDSTANALSFASTHVTDATSMSSCYIEHSLISGSTSEQTFKIRAGSVQTAATLTFNGQAGNRKFGGVVLSSIHITEIQV